MGPVESERALTGVTSPRVVTVADLARLYEAEHLAMIRLARLVTGSLEIAEEAVHDAFLTVYQRRQSIAQPGAYLRRVVINNCHGRLRRQKTERRKLESLALARRPSVELAAELDETWQALSVLNRKQRTAIVLRYYEDLTVDGIAEVMGERPGTVKSMLHRGLDRLRKELDQ